MSQRETIVGSEALRTELCSEICGSEDADRKVILDLSYYLHRVVELKMRVLVHLVYRIQTRRLAICSIA